MAASRDAKTNPLSAVTDDPHRLADDHWAYIESLLTMHGETEDIIQKVGWHYKTAFIHGFKHAMETA